MKTFLLLIFTVLSVTVKSQDTDKTDALSGDTSTINLHSFAAQATAGETSNFGKAVKLLNWLSTNLQWTATDYQTRTVVEILKRKEGNCFELAKVYMALIDEIGIQYRPIAELNIQMPDTERAANAAELIKEKGNRFSLFGLQHNDHRWVEIYNDELKIWVPADPTMNIIGFDEWLKARAWFGNRHTINDEFSNAMIVPFAIYVVDKNNKYKIVEERTNEYLLFQLNKLYGNCLTDLPAWKKWGSSISAINEAAKDAFAGTTNLHHNSNQIGSIANIYQQLKKECAAKCQW